MKTIIKPQRKAGRSSNLFYMVLTVFLLFSTNATAQYKYRDLYGPKEISPAKGIHETYTRYEMSDSSLFLINSRYKQETIRAEYPPIGPSSLVEGTFRIRVESNERLLKSVKSVFTPEKIERLAENGEVVSIMLEISHIGEPLMISFGINGASLITVEEIERLEKELLNNLVFITYDSTVKGKASTMFDIDFSFQEVIDGRVDVSLPFGSRGTW